MEFYNRYSKEYLSSLKKKSQKFLFKIELLSDEESVVGEIVDDLSNVDGQININYEQITRRSCSFAVRSTKKKYIPNKNSPFWFNRKFKIYIGLIVRDNIYWWSQGVFFTKSAGFEHGRLTIEGIDKGGALDGSLKTAMTSSQYIIKTNVGLSNVIKDLLALRVGELDFVRRGYLRNGGDKMIDPIPPIIDSSYKDQTIQTELSVDNNTYIGDLIIQLADLYAAETYYDINGRFRFEPYIINSGCTFSPTQWEFNDLSADFQNANYSTSFDGENAVCVYTNASDAGVRNVAYTAYNTNPLSPVNIDIGIRRAEDQEIEYYNVSEEQMIKDCRSAANYYLRKNSMLGIQLNFNCPLIPHLDVNKTISISDKYSGIEQGIFVVQSITIPINASTMSISATNINWLPDDMEYDGIVEGVGD